MKKGIELLDECINEISAAQSNLESLVTRARFVKEHYEDIKNDPKKREEAYELWDRFQDMTNDWSRKRLFVLRTVAVTARTHEPSMTSALQDIKKTMKSLIELKKGSTLNAQQSGAYDKFIVTCHKIVSAFRIAVDDLTKFIYNSKEYLSHLKKVHEELESYGAVSRGG